MINKLSTKFSAFILIAAFSAAVIFSSNTVNAQTLWKNNSQNPGTGTPTTTFPEEKSNKTIIYVALGAAITGLLLYKFVFHKDKKEETDSTKNANSSSLLIHSGSYFTDKDSELAKNEEALPVNLYFGVRRDNYAAEERTYVVGLSLKF